MITLSSQRRLRARFTMACVFLLVGGARGQSSAAGEAIATPLDPAAERSEIVQQAYLATYDGWSADEVLLHDERNARFLSACRRDDPQGTDAQFNWALLSLRKAGKLPGEVTRMDRQRHAAYRHAAEIAARLSEDHTGQNIDRILCDPDQRVAFDRAAQELAPDVSAYRLRKAAFALRKSRRLRPELIDRVSDWGRAIESHEVPTLRDNLALIPQRPGVYLFRDASGYLYIGESANLRERLTEHLSGSDRDSLANYLEKQHDASSITVELHVFGADSPARRVAPRRAYESELIRTRGPRFNVRS
ncbi:MAG: nucleotide excision repair endonuclease [Planctomycetales bacterium]|nr:nucleotide excision repair endonuclease [Planctomycetales bacterium]